MFWAIEPHEVPPGTPFCCHFSDWKSPKEGERVTWGHFHERVDESPQKDENVGTSGYPISFFVWKFNWFNKVQIYIEPKSSAMSMFNFMDSIISSCNGQFLCNGNANFIFRGCPKSQKEKIYKKALYWPRPPWHHDAIIVSINMLHFLYPAVYQQLFAPQFSSLFSNLLTIGAS